MNYFHYSISSHHTFKIKTNVDKVIIDPWSPYVGFRYGYGFWKNALSDAATKDESHAPSMNSLPSHFHTDGQTRGMPFRSIRLA